MRGYSVSERVRNTLRNGLDKIEEEVESIIQGFESGELNVEEYLNIREEIELRRKTIVESNIRELFATRRRGKPSQGNP